MLRVPDAPLPSHWRQRTTTPSHDFWARIRSGLSVLLLWMDRSGQRQDLAELEDHQLRDIGLTRDDIRRECGKPFWRA
jgi:uncharacterized protein YjiS (DUF1127 family)